MDDTIRVFSGRTFSSEDIETIKWITRTYSQLSRTEIAATVCELIGWVTPAGRPKKPQCAAYLDKLEVKGLIELPARKAAKRSAGKRKPVRKAVSDTRPADITECGAITLELADDADKRRRWREYISRYHTIGYKQAYGAQLKYFITSDGEDLGCLQFSAAAWALQKRDEWIGWSVEDRKARLNLVLNNSRYLVLPWVHIRNLSSRALSAAARRICEDWLNAYCYAPVLLETFVDTAFYHGTSYRAANWVYLGETQGRGRMDRHHEHGLSQKAIFMYPLRKDFRAVLQGRKPCKMVNPDE
jgi:hypothetical protein